MTEGETVLEALGIVPAGTDLLDITNVLGATMLPE